MAWIAASEDEPFDERAHVEAARFDAEDVTAATFERALRNPHGFEWRDGGLRPWLCRIAANELVDHYRREERRLDRETAAASRAVAVAHDHDHHDDLLAALSTVNPRYQEVLSLRYLADLDPDEVAAAVGVTRPHLAVLLMRARTALRRSMEVGATP